MMVSQRLLTGQVLDLAVDPFRVSPETATHYYAKGGVLIEDTQIAAVGEADDLKAQFPKAAVISHGSDLILPGFVDAHVHYPQTGIIASWGKRLIDWLNTYTFPEEMRFGDPDYAAEVAGQYLDLALAHGTTSMASFATIHMASVDAIFAAAEVRGMSVTAGRTCMDRKAPDGLQDTAQSAYDESEELIDRWHRRGRATYAITPRFTVTSTPEQLEAMGALWAKNPTCAMQTHLSEQVDEVALVAKLEPEARDYLDTYERYGLLGPGALFGHAIWLKDRERARLVETESAVVHCPTSNTFIGSGLFDMGRAQSGEMLVGLATDTGGGSSFSMLRTMAAAYEVAQLSGTALHPSQLLWLATTGSAMALRQEGRIGTLRPGSDADLVVLDLASTPGIAQRAAKANDIWESVFPTIMMGDDRAIAATYVNGQRTTQPAPQPTT